LKCLSVEHACVQLPVIWLRRIERRVKLVCVAHQIHTSEEVDGEGEEVGAKFWGFL